MSIIIPRPYAQGPVVATGPGVTLNDAKMWHTMGQFDSGNNMLDDTWTGVRPNNLEAQDILIGTGNPPTFIANTPPGGPVLTADYTSAGTQTGGIPNVSAQHMNFRGGGDLTWVCYVRSNNPSPVNAFPDCFHGAFSNSLPISFALYYFGVQRIAGVDTLVWNYWDAASTSTAILGGAVTPGVWVHYIGTRVNSTGLMTLYADDVSLGTTTLTSFTPNSGTYSIDLNFIAGGSVGDMGMCHFGVWNRIITPVERAYLAAGNKPNLAAAA